MNFVIPKNYKVRIKILGLFDYSTAIFNIILLSFLILATNIIFHNLKLQIFIVISIYFPFFLLSIFSFNQESFISVLYYIIKFIVNPKYILYDK